MASPRRIISSVAELRESVGQVIGVGDWFEITQERVDGFAEVTGDHQWIHVDVERARASRFGGTIAHGFLLLSMTPLTRGYEMAIPIKWGFNYGLDRLRFPSSALVGSRVRLHSKVLSVEEPNAGELQFTIEHKLEVEGQDKPAFVADQITRYFLEDA